MSFTQLEAQIRAWADLEAYAAANRETAQKIRAFEKAKRKRPPMYRPDTRPVCHTIIVTLNVREQTPEGLGELTEAIYPIRTISEAEAEMQAKQQAKIAGFVWRGTVSIERRE